MIEPHNEDNGPHNSVNTLHHDKSSEKNLTTSTHHDKTPGVANRTFGDRTQSNSIARLGSVIELNRTHKKKFHIERNRKFANRTVHKSNIIEHSRTPPQSETRTSFIRSETKRCGQISYLLASTSNTTATGKMSDTWQRWNFNTILEAVVKGYHECSFTVHVGDKFVVKQKRGDRGHALRVVLQWSFSSYLSESLATTA